MPHKKHKTTVYDKYNGHCAYCGTALAIKEMQIDHIVPKRIWDTIFFNRTNDIIFKKFVPLFLDHLTIDDLNHIDNLNPSCRVCNKWKSAESLESFRNELSQQVKRLNLRSSNYRIAKKYNQIKEAESPIVFYFETLKAYDNNNN